MAPHTSPHRSASEIQEARRMEYARIARRYGEKLDPLPPKPRAPSPAPLLTPEARAKQSPKSSEPPTEGEPSPPKPPSAGTKQLDPLQAELMIAARPPRKAPKLGSSISAHARISHVPRQRRLAPLSSREPLSPAVDLEAVSGGVRGDELIPADGKRNYRLARRARQAAEE
eukprot:CAMPEP_0195569080 /NCGR_PEP_ID=MMETSP0814-20130614/2615_1 /TAXON_ID=97485 /ORGANISM="Prymnesium parvum, Strain Texoma1" /LENGTH=170 /DNA_ID=CAMNT_0040704433 /DNA_START=23 /DNA_END=534 /DNA_ORIENTATION=+